MSDHPSWPSWLEQHDPRMLHIFRAAVAPEEDWKPTPEDRQVAWQLYIQLRTRISTQPLHFLAGDEVSALDSLYSLFKIIREVLTEAGPEAFATTTFTNYLLNSVIRPVTAKWHRHKVDGRMVQEDARRKFRRELQEVQLELRGFQKLMLRIARGPGNDSAQDELDRVDELQTRPLGESASYDYLLGIGSAKDGISKEIIQAERKEIRQRRAAAGQDNADSTSDLVGLAISGGGVRSSTFALGVLQGLAKHGILKQVDLISTVSGGGYLGSFISTFLNKPKPGNGLAADEAPFRADVALDSQAIRSLRNNSRYIQPTSFTGWLTSVGQVAFGIVSNLIILSFIVFVAVIATDYLFGCELRQMHCLVYASEPVPLTAKEWKLQLPSQIALSIFGILLMTLPFRQRVAQFRGKTLSRISMGEYLTAFMLVASAAVVAVDYLPNVHYAYMRLMRAIGALIPFKWGSSEGWSLTASSVTVLNTIGLLVARARWLRDLAGRLPLVGRLLFLALWMCGPGLFVYAYFELCRVYVGAPNAQVQLFTQSLDSHYFIMLLAAGAFIYSFTCNVNFTSLHRFYRNRLTETFLLNSTTDGGVQQADKQLLSNLRSTSESVAPYHLINAALNLPSSQIDELRGRDCDFFLFSKHFCGSPVIGYQKTTGWEQADSHLDLGTAMAISGAAAAPQMGLGTIKGASFLMTLLNVRMAYWQRKPEEIPRTPGKLRQLFGGPGPLYLCREALNKMHENDTFLNLSDGGHLENLAIYELIRRRSRYIVAIDGECDPNLVFPSLMQLQRFAQVDLGATIDIDVERVAWIASPAPADEDGSQAAETAASAPEPLRYSRSHFAIARITYPAIPEHCDATTGWLVYVKLSVTGNEPAVVTDYRRRNPDAPHQSTGDQVFQEDQFEAYRSLGEHVSEDMFSEELLGDAHSTGSLPVETWIQALANALYQPRE